MEDALKKLKILHDCNVLEQYAKHPYLDGARIVAYSVVNELNRLTPSSYRYNDMDKISQLCLSFYFEEDMSSMQLAYELWKHRDRLYKNYNNQYRDSMLLHGAANIFSGFGLKNYIKTILVQYSSNKNDAQIIQMCKDLIRHKFIKRAKKKDDDEAKYEINSYQDDDSKEVISSIWNSCQLFEDYNYEFRSHRHREFIKLSQPDRAAWNRGTKVQIYSVSFDGWTQGTVIQVNRNLLTVAYGSLTNHKRKVLHRYDLDKIQSSELFIYHRLCLKKGSKIQIYSLSNKCWCNGRVIEIAQSVRTQNVFKVSYLHNKQYKAKYVDRWSSLIRLDNETDEKFQKAQQEAVYKKGTKVKVYSVTQRKWIDGIIEDTVQEFVNVRYGNSEKLLPTQSHQFRLIT